MGYIAKLKRGASYIDLNAAPYKLGLDFAPPTVSEVAQVSAGTSANRYGGGTLVGKTAVNKYYSFSLIVSGTSTAQIRSLVDNLDSFLRGAGDESNPTYFWWNPDSNLSYEPMWGQSWRALEVVTGQVDYGESYGRMGTSTGKLAICYVSMEVKPYAIGRRQRLASATGCVREMAYGSRDGLSRGITIAAALTNKFTNPVFGHSTWNTDWTSSGTAATQCTDKEFVLFGTSSASIAATEFSRWYQSLDVNNTNAHTLYCFVKRHDGAAITTSHISLNYNTSTTTATIFPVGNGWYCAWAAVTGVDAAVQVGLNVAANTHIYADGFNIVESALQIPRIHIDGDQLGCAWTGTAHASTSTSTAGRLRAVYTDWINKSEGTLVAVITPRVNHDAATFTGSSLRLVRADNGFDLYYDSTNDRFAFGDGTNSAAAGTQALVAGTPQVIHATWEFGSGLAVYQNGTSVATNATYTAPAAPGDGFLYIGCTEAAVLQGAWMINGLKTYARAMTSGEVALHAANLLAAAQGGDGYGVCTDPIPYVWTKDGDDIVDQYNDATHDNFCVVGGVPGSADAETEILFTSTADFANDIDGGMVVSRFEIPYTATLDTTDLFVDLSGTVVAGTVGGEVERESVTTSDVFLSLLSLTQNTLNLLKDRPFMILINEADAGANLQAKLGFQIGGGTTVAYGAYNSIAALTSTYRNTLLGPSALPDFSYIASSYVRIASIYCYYKRTTGGASNVDTDFAQLMPLPVMTITFNDADIVTPSFLYYSNRRRKTTGLSTYISPYTAVSGTIELVPGKYNYLFSCVGDVKLTTIAGITITDTLTYTSVYVTPRWALL